MICSKCGREFAEDEPGAVVGTDSEPSLCGRCAEVFVVEEPTEEQLAAEFEEMRKRGWAIADPFPRIQDPKIAAAWRRLRKSARSGLQRRP